MGDERRCGSCGARNTLQAPWCALCHTELGAPTRELDPSALLDAVDGDGGGSARAGGAPTQAGGAPTQAGGAPTQAGGAGRQDGDPGTRTDAGAGQADDAARTGVPAPRTPLSSAEAAEAAQREWVCGVCRQRNELSSGQCARCGISATEALHTTAGMHARRAAGRQPATLHGRLSGGGFTGGISARLLTSFLNGLELIVLSVRLTFRHPALLAVPAVTGAVVAAVTGLVAWIAGVEPLALLERDELDAAGRVAYLLVYGASYIAGIFGQAVLVLAVTDRFDGRPVELASAVRRALDHLGPLVRWALIDAVVGLVLDALRDRGAGRAATALGVAWHTATVLVVPMIALEGVGPGEAIRRSRWMLGRVWSRALVGGFGLGLVMAALTLVTVLGTVLLAAFNPWLGFALLLAGVIAVQLAAAVAGGVLTAGLYRYALTGEVPAPFTARVLKVPAAV